MQEYVLETLFLVQLFMSLRRMHAPPPDLPSFLGNMWFLDEKLKSMTSSVLTFLRYLPDLRTALFLCHRKPFFTLALKEMPVSCFLTEASLVAEKYSEIQKISSREWNDCPRAELPSSIFQMTHMVRAALT